MIRKTGIAAAVLFAGFIVSVNSIPAMAKSLLDMAFVGPFVKVFVFTDYKTEENGFEANISVPNIAGFENKQLENELNEKFIKEGQKLYDDFLRKMEEIKSNTNDGHYSVNSGYEVCADNEDVFSIRLLSKHHTNTGIRLLSKLHIDISVVVKKYFTQCFLTLSAFKKQNA